MRTIIAGSRSLGRREVDLALSECGWIPTVVLSGRARGVDLAGEQWAHEHGIAYETFPPDWIRFGKRAGIVRNAIMASTADALIAVWDGKSPGTRDMINRAILRGLKIYVWQEEKQDDHSSSVIAIDRAVAFYLQRPDCSVQQD